MGEALDLLAGAIAVESLDGVDNSRMLSGRHSYVTP
jgi:hypothetical protein